MNAAQHKIVNLLKTFFFFGSLVFDSVCIFNVWPKTTFLLPVSSKETPKDRTPLVGVTLVQCLHGRLISKKQFRLKFLIQTSKKSCFCLAFVVNYF